MRISAAALLAFVIYSFGAPTPASADTQPNSCVKCHIEMGDELAKPVTDMKGDIHDSRGISCAGCHGGDPTNEDREIAMNPAGGFVGKPKGEQRIQMCARCHSDAEFMKKFNPALRVDQAEIYKTSVHGNRLLEGDERPATCASCHGNHRVFPPSDTRSSVYPTNVPATCGKCHSNSDYMRQYGIPTDQVEKYTKSVHAVKLLKEGDLSSPACNDCHGNHGATPPGVGSLAYVCSQCHPVQQELYSKSPHAKSADDDGKPSCVECHNNHEILMPSDKLIGVGEGALCVNCHDKDSQGYKAAAIFSEKITRLKRDIETTETKLTKAEDNGMPSIDSRYEIEQGKALLVKVRTLIHSFSLATVDEKLMEASKGIEKADGATEKFFKDLEFRKAGLWLTWLFIAIFSIALIIKIKGLNSKNTDSDCTEK